MCLNPWHSTEHTPLQLKCGHHVCADCWRQVRSAFYVGKPCPICRCVCEITNVDTAIVMFTECGLVSSIDNLVEHGCDSCWCLRADSIDACMAYGDIPNLKRWLRIGKSPSPNAVITAIDSNQEEAVATWLATPVVVSFQMVKYAARVDADGVLARLADRCDVASCDLPYLYQLEKIDALLGLWARGARSTKLIEAVVKDNNSRLLRKLYGPECIVPAAAIFSPTCAKALLDMGHAFDSPTIRLYMECRGSITRPIVEHLLRTGGFAVVGIDADNLDELASGLLRAGMLVGFTWVLRNGGGGTAQELVDAMYVSEPSSKLTVLLEHDVMPSPGVLGSLSGTTLRLVYTYQCSECDTLTSARCAGCDNTRFCSPACREKAIRHTPFCKPVDELLTGFTGVESFLMDTDFHGFSEFSGYI